MNAVVKHICEECIAFSLNKNLPSNAFIEKVKLYTKALDLGALKELCFETFYLILHADHYYKIYKDFILKNGNSRIIEYIHKNVDIIFLHVVIKKKKLLNIILLYVYFAQKIFQKTARNKNMFMCPQA